MRVDSSKSLLECVRDVRTAFVDSAVETSTFNVGNTLQSYFVPEDGWYILETVGAQGGPASNDSHQGGKGALLRGRVQLKKGDKLGIAVGEKGKKGSKGSGDGNNPSGGGGGGASSIVKVNGDFRFEDSSNELLLMSGGGGGGASQGHGFDAQTDQDGGNRQNCFDLYNIYCSTGKGGTSGNGGGLGSAKRGGAGGAGYYSDGGTHCSGDCNSSNFLSRGGKAYVNGNSGGCTNDNGGCGGFGGGGEGGPGKFA